MEYKTGGHVCTKIILLPSLAFDETYAVLKISFATMPHAVGLHMGSDIFNFVVFLGAKAPLGSVSE